MSELLYLRALLAQRHLVDQATGCWIWQMQKDYKGYGSVTYGGRTQKAHRVYYQICIGPIPDGLVLDHLCDNPSCVNPDHLRPSTHRENILRGNGVTAQNARKTHCLNGHPYDAENTEIIKRGPRIVRRCIVCRRNRAVLQERREREQRRQQGLNARGRPYASDRDRKLAESQRRVWAERALA